MTFGWKSSKDFFVRKITAKGDVKGKAPERLDAEIIAQAKHIGMSFSELNEITTQDFLDIIHAYAKESQLPENGRRRATQADIDRLLG